jgi:hypothetical protein
MPLTSRITVKSSIIYLGLGAVLGVVLLINRWLPLGSAIEFLRASHVQFLIVGWLTQFIIGVAWWLLPPLAIGQRDDAPLRLGQRQRGSEILFWAALAFLNIGILLRALFEPLHGWTTRELFGILADMSGVALLVASVLFVVNLWGRVRELGKARSG